MAWDGRTPTSIASAIVYITVMLEEVRGGVCTSGCVTCACTGLRRRGGTRCVRLLG